MVCVWGLDYMVDSQHSKVVLRLSVGYRCAFGWSGVSRGILHLGVPAFGC